MSQSVQVYQEFKKFIYGPGEFPDCHEDIENSKYSSVTTCNLLNKIQDSRAELNQMFAYDDMGMPKLLIIDDRRTKQNAKQYEFYMDQEPVVVNKPGCNEPFNVRSLNDAAGLQAGYARNIDLESELHRINHITDKCFYDNYKLHPDDTQVPNGLACNRDCIVNDYSVMGQPACSIPSTPKSVITPADNQKPIQDAKYSSSNQVSYGQFNMQKVLTGTEVTELGRDYSRCNSLGMQLPIGQCTRGGIPQTFPLCDSGYGIDNRAQQIINWRAQQNNGTVPDYYRFNGDVNNQQAKYTANFPCQRLFNNNTKRSSLPNLFNTFDPNPRYLV